LQAQSLNLIVKGGNEIEHKLIDSISYKKIFTNYKSLQTELSTLQLNLQKAGYIESQLNFTTKQNDTTYIASFSLKKKYYTIYIYYDENTIPKSLLKSITDDVHSDYFVTTIQKSESILKQINSKLIENGQPFSALKLENLKKKSNTSLEGKLSISNHDKRTLDNIIVKGYENFPRTYLKHYLELNQGDPFDLNTINKKTAFFRELKFANQTKLPEVLFTNDSTSLYLYIEKTKSNSFDGFIGFSTNEISNKLEFNGYLNLILTNNLNYGETFKLIYKSTNNEQKTFQVNISTPYLFGSPIGAELSLNIFKKDSTFTTVNQSADLFYQVKKNQKVFLGINAIKSNNISSIIQNPLVQDYNVNFYNLKYEIIKRQYNSLLFPTNFFLNLKVGIGTRKLTDNEEKQSIFNIKTHKIFNLNNRNSFYIELNTASINSNNYLNNELLRFGGINSIRGFEEQGIIASFYNVIKTEYRYTLNSNIYVHSIIDAAYFENELTNIKEKLFGFGLGLGLSTKAGLLILNYAVGKSENQNFKLSNSKIHISLNANF